MEWIQEAILNSGGYLESNLSVSNHVAQKGGVQGSVSLMIWWGECCKSVWLCVCPRVLFVCLFLPFRFLMSAEICKEHRSQHLAVLQEAAVCHRFYLWNSLAGCSSWFQCSSYRSSQDSLPRSANPCDHPVYGGWVSLMFLFGFLFISFLSVSCILYKSSCSLHGTGGFSTLPITPSLFVSPRITAAMWYLNTFHISHCSGLGN